MPQDSAVTADYTGAGGPVITLTPVRGSVRVTFAGEAIAESTRALALAEGTYPRRIYIPREDVRMGFLERSTHVTRCPWKGEASYFHVEAGGKRSADAAWSYELPLAQLAAIGGHICFYDDRVEAISATG